MNAGQKRGVAIGLSVALGFAVMGTAHAYPGETMQKDAAIGPGAAKSIALKAQPGTIAAMELEREAGGSGLRYSFDIKASGKTHEVGVDAKSGSVLENSVEGAHAD